MTASTSHYVATSHSETATLKARYDEALAIKEAWDHRVAKASATYRGALASGEGVEETRNQLAAVNLQHEEAVAWMGICLDAWVDAVDTARHRAAVLAVRAGKGRGGVIPHPRHF